MKTLNELDILEEEIYTRIHDHNNSKNQDQSIIDTLLSDCFKKYKAIHISYIELIKGDDASMKLEALKRALFIQWIGSLDPSFLTGIEFAFEAEDMADETAGIELAEIRFVYEYLDQLIEEGTMDLELFEMLSYYSHWEYIFEREDFKDLNQLQHFVQTIDQNKSWSSSIKMRDLSHRGQMGLYFLSLGS